MLTRLIVAALAVVGLAPLSPLDAQEWPARTITMCLIVGLAARDAA